MTSLWKVVKWVLVFIVLTLILGTIVNNYISPWLKEKELTIFQDFFTICVSYWKYLVLSLTIIVVILFCVWTRERKEQFRNLWEFYKPAEKLTREDFKIQKYKKEYIQRESNKTIENLLENGKHILIIGKPKIGKTRAAYEEIRKLKNISVIKLRPEDIEIVKIRIPPLSNRNLVLFIDDFERFIGHNIEDIIDRLRKEYKKLIIVANCRTGKELTLVQEEKPHLYREFIRIKLEEISETNGRDLAKQTGMKWKKTEFDGTPGSVILDLEDMKNRYKKAGDGKIILKALKLLREGNLHIYKETRVKDICGDIFELTTEKLKRYNWDGIINNLKETDFITIDKGLIDIYPSYLEICVYDYDAPLNDLLKLKNMLMRFKDSGSLSSLGRSFYYKEEFEYAKDCYLDALKIYPKYAYAHSGLGYVLTKLGEAEESKRNIGEAERLYKEAEKEHREAIGIKSNYFVNHNNLGYVLTRLGEVEELKGKYSEARRLYNEAEKEHRIAIGLNQNFSHAHRCLAYALDKLEMHEEAEKGYRESIRLDPESPFVHNLLGYLLANKLGRNEEAEMEYRKAIKIMPDYPSARNNLGHLLAKLGRWQEAEKEYREAIKSNPDYFVAYVNLGFLLVNLGKYEEAEEEYRKALSINPRYAEAHNALGYALGKLKRYDEAEIEYRKAIEIKPDYAEAHRNFGYLLVMLKKSGYDEAEKEYRKALQLSPNDEDTLICLGILFEKLNKDKEAEDCYKRVIGENPNNINARTTYGYFLSFRGRVEEAAREFEEVLKIHPNDTKVHDQIMYLHSEQSDIHAKRARALIKTGMFDEAKQEIIEALILDPNSASAHKNLGILQEELGDRAKSNEDKSRLYKEAEKEYKKALELYPMYPSARRHLANTLEKLGRYNEAEKEYKETKKVAENYPKNNRDFGIFLSKIGRKEDAKKELELALELFEKQGNEKEAREVKELLKGHI